MLSKVVKYALIAMIALPFTLMGVGLFFPGKLVIESESLIDGSRDDVHSLISSAGNWVDYEKSTMPENELAALKENSFEVQATGVPSGVGSGLQYYLDGTVVASYVIRRVVEDKEIHYDFSYENLPLTGRGIFTLETVGGKVKVHRKEIIDMGPNPALRLAGSALEKSTRLDFKRFFEGLNEVLDVSRNLSNVNEANQFLD